MKTSDAAVHLATPPLPEATLPPSPELPETSSARILVVDDEPGNLLLLEAILQDAGYADIRSITDPRQVEDTYTTFEPDLMMLDLMMPHLDGFQVMQRLNHKKNNQPFVPILVLTADISPETKRRALREGAHDFLTKPFDAVEVLLRIRSLLSLHFAHAELHDQNQTLEQRVRERTQELEESHRLVEESQLEVLDRLAHAAEFRDDETGQHTQRVGRLCAQLAEQLGFGPDRVAVMRRAAPLHDVGKIGIPDSILLKPGKLTPEEFDVMKTHAEIGANLLAGGRSQLVQMAELIARSHHERWNGAGYPHGLSGENIPLEGRIVAIVDVFDALTHERPYKAAWTVEAAVEEIKSQRGRQFDPRVVDAFLQTLA
jgi:putative two-component system response regulator